MTTIDAGFERRPRHALPAAVISLAVVAVCLSGLADGVLARALVFYGAVSGAYATMPYVRRGDIPLVAMWVVMAVELAPLTLGRLISPATVAADTAGVLMATAPIYIARVRQLLQGDTQAARRRRADPSA